MSDENLDQMWKTVFRARATLSDARLGVTVAHDDLLRTIEDVLSVVDRLRCRYDTQYAHLRLAQRLLREMTRPAPIDHPGDGRAWHVVPRDLLLEAEKFLLHTAQHDNC